MEPPAPLLPATLGKLKRVARATRAMGWARWMRRDAAVLTEDGLKRFARSDYGAGRHGSAGNGDRLSVRAMPAARSRRTTISAEPGMRPEKLGDEAVSNGGRVAAAQRRKNVVRENFKLPAAMRRPLMQAS